MLMVAAVLMSISSCDLGTSTADSYTICAEKTTTTKQQSGSATSPAPKAKPMRLCSYYVNNTIDEPTQTIINAWVPVGSRLCIGDEPPEPAAAGNRTAVSNLVTRDTLTGYSNAPIASWSPGGQLVMMDPATFQVAVNNRTTTGTLLGTSAQIRFTAVSVTWNFSDGGVLSGSGVSRSFSVVDTYAAVASVSYRVDYQISGSDWVIGASSIVLESNELEIEVIEPPRRSLLVE